MLSNTLNLALTEAKMSKTQFAKELDISKSFVVRVLNGEKALSRNMLERILRVSSLSEKSRSKILEEYLIDNLGNDSFRDITFLCGLINGFGKEINKHDPIFIRKDILSNILFDKRFTYCANSENEFYEIACYFAEKSIESDGKFYTNFSFDQKILSSLLFTEFYKRDYSRTVDFQHIINVNFNDAKQLFNSLFDALKWSETLYNTQFTPSSSLPSGLLFPFYIITDEAVVIFNETCSKALVFNEKSTVDFYLDYFNRIKAEYHPMLAFIKDELDAFNDDQLSKCNLQYTVDGALCLMQFCDSEILYDSIQPYIEQKDYLINAVISYFGDTFKKRPKQYMTKSALSKFVDDGQLRIVTERYLSPLSKQSRQKLLNNLRSNLENILLIDENKLSPYKEMDIHIYDRKFAVSLYPSNPNAKHYNVYFEIPYDYSDAVEKAVRNFADFIELANYAHSKQYTREIIDEMILRCK